MHNKTEMNTRLNRLSNFAFWIFMLSGFCWQQSTFVLQAQSEDMCVIDDHSVRNACGNIPEIARGNEEVYQRFYNGKLVYRPNKNSDEGKIELFIRDLANPTEGIFDLSCCGDAGDYLSINTGYRKHKNPANADKVEIWLTPKFLIEKELHTSASHFGNIVHSWNNGGPVGIFWTWGNTDELWII